MKTLFIIKKSAVNLDMERAKIKDCLITLNVYVVQLYN